MRSPRVALVIDHPQRDLAGMVLLAHDLCRRGIICHLVPLNVQATEIMALAPDFVLLNYLRVCNYNLARRLADAGIRFGMVDTEGGVWEDLESYSELLWTDHALLQRAQPACIWGPALADYLRSHGLLTDQQTHVTGCPRFDFYAPRWRSVLTPGPGTGHPSGQAKTVLINTNFSVVNPRFTTPEQNREFCHREYGWTYERIDEVTKKEGEAIRETISIATSLRRDFPQARIVLRPHPFESDAPYREALERQGVELNTAGPVQSQISSADVVIQRSCTTAVEAAAAGIPTLSPQWMPAPYLMPMAEDVSVSCHSYRDLREVVGSILVGKYEAEANLADRIRQIVGRWFYRIDGFAHQRVAAAIESALEADSTVNLRLCRQYAHGLGGDDGVGLRERTSEALRYLLQLPPDWSFRQMKSVRDPRWAGTAKEIQLSQVQSLVRAIELAEGSPHDNQPSVCVALASDRRDYQSAYRGAALTMWSAAVPVQMPCLNELGTAAQWDRAK